MEQKDYLLRETEKIGLVLKAIREKLIGSKDNLAIPFETQVEVTKGILLSETSFDIDKFMALGIEDSNEYLCSFDGFNIENIELLAECISQIGFSNKQGKFKKHLEKALQLYEFCNFKSKTYSFEREANIKAIRSAL